LVLEQLLDRRAHRPHFDAPIHWVTGKELPDNAVDTIPPAHFLAPACVIDCSAESAADPDFVLTIPFVETWETRHGRVPPKSWVLLRTDWHKRPPKQYVNLLDDGPHSPGPGLRQWSSGWSNNAMSTASAPKPLAPTPVRPPISTRPIPRTITCTAEVVTASSAWRTSTSSHPRGAADRAAEDPPRLRQPPPRIGTDRDDTMTVAVVTGGSTGIGAAICTHMLDGAYRVVSIARREPADPRCEHIEVDLLDPVATAQAAQDIAARHAITHIIHNAGVIKPALLPDVTPTDLAALTRLHLNAALALTQAALPSMRAAGYGRIVLISSRAALGLATRTAYSATKAAMIGMARTWALELAPDGITVNVVAPGPIRETEMFHDVVPADSPREAALAAAIPVKRLGAPDDVARAVMFFANPTGSFITGQTCSSAAGPASDRSRYKKATRCVSTP
jgi:NAD(P)-dependent dehydrogenase (short-subunit alcohol dehydrogenase family)